MHEYIVVACIAAPVVLVVLLTNAACVLLRACLVAGSLSVFGNNSLFVAVAARPVCPESLAGFCLPVVVCCLAIVCTKRLVHGLQDPVHRRMAAGVALSWAVLCLLSC